LWFLDHAALANHSKDHAKSQSSAVIKHVVVVAAAAVVVVIVVFNDKARRVFRFLLASQYNFAVH
jgi:hypothetical protein